jgi:hypothetical protein
MKIFKYDENNIFKNAISIALNNIINQNSNQFNIEFEIRFGNYGKISSDLSYLSFSEVNSFIKKSVKYKELSYTYIKDTIFKKGECKNRTVYNDNGIIKNMFKSPDLIKNVENNITALTQNNKSKEDVYIKKEKILRSKLQNKFNGFKLDLVKEIIYDKNKYNNTEIALKSNIKATRHKFRCSYYSEIWTYDLTVMIYQDENTKKYNTFYEIEMEFNNSYIKQSTEPDIEKIYQSLIYNINKITNIINCIETRNNIEQELNSGTIHNSVVTLEKSNFHYLQNAKYAVCDKADGERKFLYISENNEIFHINPTADLIEKIYIGRMSSNKIACSLLDCELITEFAQSGSYKNKKPIFFGFDLLFYNNKDCRSFNLTERLKLLKEAMIELENNKIVDNKNEFSFKPKQFYTSDIYKHADTLWKNKSKLFPYALDGLIFTPINSSYVGYLPNLKWKDNHSIDIRIFYNKYDDFTEFYSHGRPVIKNDIIINEYKVNGEVYYKNKLYISGNDKPIQKYKELNLINSNSILGVRGKLVDNSGNQLPNMIDIIEVEFLYSSKKWIYLRKREDKDKPNAYLSILSVLNAVVDNITTDDIKRINYTPSIYDTIEKNDKCHSDIGFNFIDGNTYINKFYTYSYEKIFNIATDLSTTVYKNDKNILILGCDKMLLCGLYSYLSSIKDPVNITIIESNCINVFACKKSEGFIGLLECSNYIRDKMASNGLKHTIEILWGGLNIFDNKNSYTEFNKKHISKKSKYITDKKYDILYINNLEYTFFNKETCRVDIKLFDNYINMIKHITKSGGIIISNFLSGNEIENELKRNKCILLQNDTFHPLYKIYKSKNITTKDNTSNLIQINRMDNGFFKEYQPFMSDENILMKFKMLKKIKCNSFKSFYTEYTKKTQNQIPEYDLIISNITKYVIFQND